MNEKSHMELLLRKYVDDRVSGDELEILQDFLKTPEGLEALERVMNEHRSEFVGEEIQGAPTVLGAPDRKSRRLYPALAIAASFIGIFTICAVYFYINRKPELVEFQTSAGQTLDIILPDNTKVTLNAESHLSYMKDWSNSLLREVTLDGEAYFKVVHNPQVPFRVNANGINVRVLGTTFDVKSYGDESFVETTLVEGKVVIEDQDKGEALLELLPNQKALYNKNDGKISMKEASSDVETSWTRGVVVFEDKPFGEIIKVLERRYGVKIQVSNETSLQCKFNATIEKESLADVLKLFGTNGTMKYEMRGNHDVLIQGSVCGV